MDGKEKEEKDLASPSAFGCCFFLIFLRRETLSRPFSFTCFLFSFFLFLSREYPHPIAFSLPLLLFVAPTHTRPYTYQLGGRSGGLPFPRCVCVRVSVCVDLVLICQRKDIGLSLDPRTNCLFGGREEISLAASLWSIKGKKEG